MRTIYYHPLSTFARRVRIALIEKGLDRDTEFVEVDMFAEAHKHQPYLSLNPYGRVPTLREDDGFVLYESTAILEYVEALHPTPRLVPADARGRGRVSQHMKLCDLQLTRQTGTIIFPRRFLPQDRWNAAAMDQAKREIESHLEILDRQLQDTDYVVGNNYSLVEVCYTPFVEFFPLMEITPPPHIAAWTARILARPSAQATKPAR